MALNLVLKCGNFLESLVIVRLYRHNSFHKIFVYNNHSCKVTLNRLMVCILLIGEQCDLSSKSKEKLPNVENSTNPTMTIVS